MVSQGPPKPVFDMTSFLVFLLQTLPPHLLHTTPFLASNTDTHMRDRWETMREAINLNDVTPHVLRHTCCTRLVLGGVDVKRVMEWMGHDAIVTTMRYMQIKPTSLEEIVHILERNPDNGAGDPRAEAA